MLLSSVPGPWESQDWTSEVAVLLALSAHACHFWFSMLALTYTHHLSGRLNNCLHFVSSNCGTRTVLPAKLVHFWYPSTRGIGRGKGRGLQRITGLKPAWAGYTVSLRQAWTTAWELVSEFGCSHVRVLDVCWMVRRLVWEETAWTTWTCCTK